MWLIWCEHMVWYIQYSWHEVGWAGLGKKTDEEHYKLCFEGGFF